jgi:hypothetical protein
VLISEVDIVADGLVEGLARHAALVAALAAALPGRVREVRDLSARVVRDEGWLARVATGRLAATDGVRATVGAAAEGPRGVGWVLTHGAARFGVPDLELYGVAAGSDRPQRPPPSSTSPSSCSRWYRRGALAPGRDAAPARAGPRGLARTAGRLAGDRDAPGVDRGPGLDGPRATLSVLHRPRFGRYRLDLDGVRGAPRVAPVGSRDGRIPRPARRHPLHAGACRPARELLSTPDFAHADLETVVGLLEEAGRFAEEVVAPTNRDGDREGARLVDGRVVTPDELP